jgi:UDPglucose--hexose-1-phosphate uridylyltransferase
MTVREIRKNPFTGEWIIFSEIRQERPDRDKSKCPLCTGSEEVPEFTKPFRIANKFPAMSRDSDFRKYKTDDFFEKMTAYGECELVVYTDNHLSKFIDLTQDESMQILEVWMYATKELSSDKSIKYILPFENLGDEVGATIIHPHGQIYAFPVVPNRIALELNSIVNYYKDKNSCMVCDYLSTEQQKNERLIYEDDSIIALVPYFAEYAYDVYIYPKRHVSFLHQCTRSEIQSVLNFVPQTIEALNKIFEKEISYSFSLHQGPVNTKGSNSYHMYYKIHTPQRNKDSRKLLGAVETSTGTFINGILPKTAASSIRNKII